MEKRTTQILTALIAIAATFYGCELSDLENRASQINLPDVPYSYKIGIDDNVPTLGRVLFYDTRISANNEVSCASCHKQELAFSDDKKFSRGLKGEFTTRNSMSIQNIVSTSFPFNVPVDSGGSVSSTSLFWDGRQQDIITMVVEPIQNHIEMGVSNLTDLVEKVKSISDYKALFQNAFGTQIISKDKIAYALSAFIVSIRSDQSKFDQALNGKTSLSSLEMEGQDHFFNTYDCNSCHQLQQVVNGYQNAGSGPAGGFADIGLEKTPSDAGAYRRTGDAADIGKFKIASLRNIGLTAPYMHDGRLKTLEEVIDHYSQNIEDSPNLDNRLRNADGTPKKFNIPASHKMAIIAFLNSTTDYQLLHNVQFSNPFVVR